MSRVLAAGFMVASAALLALMAFDRLSVRGAGPIARDPMTTKIAGYEEALRPPSELLAALRTGDVDSGQSPAELHSGQRRRRFFGDEVDALNSLVFESLAHGPSRPITFSQNWLAWGLGLMFEDLRRTQMPERVVRGGQGLCHDAVAVLIQLAHRHGLEARMIDLDGHVLALFEKGVHRWVADPDYGFIFSGTLERLSQAEGRREAREAVRDAGHGPRHQDTYVAALATSAHHRIVPGARLSPRLALVEHVLNALAWLIPVMVLGMLCRTEWRRRTRLEG